MDKTKLKVIRATEGADYNSIDAEYNGAVTSFALSKNFEVAQLEGRTVYISTDETGAFQIEPVTSVIQSAVSAMKKKRKV